MTWRRGWEVVGAVARRTAARVRSRDLVLVAAGLTLYAAVTAVPMALFSLYGAGLLLGHDQVEALVGQASAFLAGPLAVDAAARAVAQTARDLGVSSLGASLATASLYGEGLLRAVRAFHPEVPRRRLAWRGRALVVPYVLSYPLLAAAGLLGVRALDGALGTGAGAQVLGTYLAFLLGWAWLTAQLLVLYRLFGPARPSRAALLWGAGSAASFLTGMAIGWVPVLRLGVDVGRAYGGSTTLGRLVLAVVFLGLFQVVLLVGSQVVAAVDGWRQSQNSTSPPSRTSPTGAGAARR